MNISSITLQGKTTNENVATNVRKLVAQYLGVNDKRVSDGARFRKDSWGRLARPARADDHD